MVLGLDEQLHPVISKKKKKGRSSSFLPKKKSVLLTSWLYLVTVRQPEARTPVSTMWSSKMAMLGMSEGAVRRLFYKEYFSKLATHKYYMLLNKTYAKYQKSLVPAERRGSL